MQQAPSTWRPAPPRPGSAPPVGNFSPAVIVGDLVLTSGQIPQDPETGSIDGDAPFAAQARRVLENIERAVSLAGARREDVVAVTIYLADIGDWAELNQVFGEFFAAPYPSRTVVGARLEGFRVEATALAVRPGEAG